ncbi:MAG TPA: GPW/gp25 family protein [Candidatus Deferrimicrobium sp.]|nr:GPW/gp25 family protein [Candidatus Deferrimicrobium sp.]
MKVDEGLLYGRGMSFPPRVEDGRVAWSSGARNIRESIKIILLTEPQERLMLPQFGGGLQKFLFEPNTVTTRRVIQHHITQSLGRWEPRIRLKSVTVDPDGKNPQAAVITIDYTLVSTGADDRLNLAVQLGG